MAKKSELALFGGPKAVNLDVRDIFTWPIITREDEEAALAVLRRGGMSGTDVTKEFEKDFSAWQGTKYALGCSTGTAALQLAMYGCGIGRGDEIIAPSLTYWATCLPVFSIGGTIVFAEVNPKTLCLDPRDVERRITKRTKAIVPVHLYGHPADMDPIMAIAKKHNLKVIEDVSHAQGGLYKGRKLGAIGHVGAMSLMSGKSLAIGEAGILVTDDRAIYERACAFGHYERYQKATDVQDPELQRFAGLPLGGYKYRMHQISSAVGRVQLKHYDERCKEIRRAMNYFWDLLEGVKGVRAHRVPPRGKSNMAGWYAAAGLYVPEELGGLSLTRFSEAMAAEGAPTSVGVNKPLHTHPLFNEADVYGDGKPTRSAFSDRDMSQPKGSLPVTERAGARAFFVPWFKKYYPEIIEQYAAAYSKVSRNYKELLKDDKGDPSEVGGWSAFRRYAR